jgi:hypothetical protein
MQQQCTEHGLLRRPSHASSVQQLKRSNDVDGGGHVVGVACEFAARAVHRNNAAQDHQREGAAT